MRTRFLAIALAALAGCDSPRVYRESEAQKLDVADINSRAAISAARANADRIERLERRVNYLERELRR